MARIKRENLTEGSIFKLMIAFVLPVFATSVLQQAFNTADMMILGRFVGDEAYAAVGSTSTIVGLFIEFFLGFSIGANVVISRFIGNGNAEKSSKAVHSSLMLALICGSFIALMGMSLTEPMLRLTHVPEELVEDATLYLRIYFAGMPFYMLYNFAAAVFRSVGKTRLPLFCLTVGGALNVVLNAFFVLVLSRGVDGVAMATVISNAVSFVLLIGALRRERDDIRFYFGRCRIDKSILWSIIRIGLPSGFLGSVFSISNLCIQSVVNSLGTKVIAASSSAANIEIYMQYIGNAFAQACATMVSQNLGAGKIDRCKRTLATALSVCMSVTFVISVVVYILSPYLVKIFTLDETVIMYARRRMIYTLLFKVVQCVMDVTVGALQGYGRTLVPASVSMIGVCGLRLLWIFTVFPMFRSVDALFIVYPITWAIASVCDLIYFAVCYKKSKQEKQEEQEKAEGTLT